MSVRKKIIAGAAASAAIEIAKRDQAMTNEPTLSDDLASEVQRLREEIARKPVTDSWSAGEEDADGNELVTMRKDEVQQMAETLDEIRAILGEHDVEYHSTAGGVAKVCVEMQSLRAEIAGLKALLGEKDAWKAMAGEARNKALEEATKACEQQRQEFLSPQYATGQPLSSLSERFACGMCITAIRALKDQNNGAA